MVVKIAPYNSGGYNAEAEETEWIDYRIVARLNEPAEAVITIADPTGAKMQKYNAASGAVGGAVADDGGVETDETTAANNATTNDMTLLPAAPAVGDAYYFGFSRTFNAVQLNISTAATATVGYTITWEYSKGSDVWAALAGVTDGTATYTNAGLNTIDWTVPSDWATDEVGAISGLYWVRGRVSIFVDVTIVPIGQQAWIEGVFTGPGRLTIENPASTDIFDGRILKAIGDSGSRTLQLMCKDWLSQLDDPVITYDMREDLDGSGLREGTAHSDPDGAYVGPAQNSAGTFYFYDDAMAWANDAYNGNYLALSNGMAGNIKVKTGPYSDTITWHGGTHTDAGDFTDVWVDDANFFTAFDADADFEVDFEFRVYVGHNTPSDFYVHDSISGARLYWSGISYSTTNTGEVHPEIWTGAAYQRIGGPISERGAGRRSITLTIPDEYISSIVDANGIVKIRFAAEHNGELTVITTHYMKFEVDVETIGYSSAVTIDDTITTNKLEIATDLTAAATRIWEGIPYAIVQEVYKHIDTVEGGTLVSDYDVLVALTAAANIEHTSGFSTRRYENSTPLAIIQDLANIDKTAFWMPIGTTGLTMKSTFNDGAPTAMTDDSVIRWGTEYSFVDVRNGFILYGPKINDNLLRLDTKDITGGDPGVDSKSTYGITRYKVVKNAGVNTEYELSALGSALVERDEDVLLFLNCDIGGLSALRLGDEVSITSTYMNLTAAKYVITYWEYSYAQNITQLRLHPRLSTKGFVQHVLFSDSIRRLASTTEHLAGDVDYLPAETST